MQRFQIPSSADGNIFGQLCAAVDVARTVGRDDGVLERRVPVKSGSVTVVRRNKSAADANGTVVAAHRWHLCSLI